MFLKYRLQVRNFIKKHKNKIVIVIVVWIIILIINYMLSIKPEQPKARTTYNMHESTLNSDQQVPEELNNPIEDLLYDYIEKCNNKDYEGAFKLLTSDCKSNQFDDSLEIFSQYVDELFPKRKRYSPKSYSNYGNLYIYSVKIIDDILTTGLTGEEYAYHEEKIAIKKEGNDLKLSVNNYMGNTELKNIAEDDYLKIRIEGKEEYYDYEIFTVRVTNKTETKAILYDGVCGNEILLKVGNDERNPTVVNEPLVIAPGETKSVKMTFLRMYEETSKENAMTFNKIRFIKDYTGNEESEEEQKAKAEKVYSVEIKLQ